MYEFKHEAERKGKINKIYISLFIMTVLTSTIIDFFDLGVEKVSGYRIVGSLFVSGIILYSALRRKLWAEILLKFLVWLHIILLFIIVVVKLAYF